jgi:polyisoprenoid-binding protein YceI
MPRSRLLIIVAVVVIAVGIGGFIVYDQVLRGDSAAALTLPKASTGTASTASTAPAATAAAAASADPATSAVPAAGAPDNVAGTWNVAADSVAGYRVREQLANLPAQSDAVGRTDQVSGSITIETTGTTTTLTGGTLTVDTTTIASDKPMRDNRLRNEGLQTNSYPTATFTLTKPVEVPAAALTGTASDITLTGDLTLHGVTKSVEIPAQAQLVNGTVQVAGSINFPLSDYSIVAPNVGAIIVSIADNGTLEFLVNFTKA